MLDMKMVKGKITLWAKDSSSFLIILVSQPATCSRLEWLPVNRDLKYKITNPCT